MLLIDYGLNDRSIGLAPARLAWSEMIGKALAQGMKVILLTPTGDSSARLGDPLDPLNQHAEQIRQLAAQFGVGLADSLAAFQTAGRAGTKIEELLSQPNHPNRRGHDLVVAELMKWFAPR